MFGKPFIGDELARFCKGVLVGNVGAFKCALLLWGYY